MISIIRSTCFCVSLIALVLSFSVARVASAQVTPPIDYARVQQLFNAGNSLLGAGNPQGAIDKYSDAILVAPTEPLLYVNRGVAYLSLAKYSEANLDADKALSLLEKNSNPSAAAIAHQVKGTVFQNAKDYARAAESFTKSIELEPSDAKFWNSRGNAFRLLKQPDSALADYNKAIELDSKLPMPYINRASVYLSQKNYQAALRDLDDVLRLDSSNASAHYTRGNTNVALKKYDEAIQDYDKAISIERKAGYFHARGVVYFMQSKFDLAVKDNTEAITLDPANVSAYRNRAISYTRLGKDALALEDTRKALALRGESSNLRYNLAYVLYKTGQISAALNEVTKVIAAAPNWRDPYILRSNCYVKLGNQIKAKADRATAAKLSAASRPAEEGELIFDLDIFVPEEVDQ